MLVSIKGVLIAHIRIVPVDGRRTWKVLARIRLDLSSIGLREQARFVALCFCMARRGRFDSREHNCVPWAPSYCATLGGVVCRR